ncbi:MAG: DUF1810 domain-containing protein [Mesorhizobium sp.]|nr:DUF1810 domain-containing protein [Mesorhizobium sp.]MBN9241651.1 DUF1810 domain-containing protein [Mesorhizobium sp.]
MTSNPFDLERFVKAQAPVFETVLRELRDGRKANHWMWFAFPQIEGLGFSAMAQRYAIASLDEARAYLEHPVLGSRLRQCVEMLLTISGRSAHEVFGSPDDMKLHSSLTLFAAAAPEEALFRTALDRFFDGHADQATRKRL